MSYIQIDHLSKSFTQGAQITHVLDTMSYVFDAERTVALTGVSGTGKSTLLHILAGLDTPSSGKVLFNGADISKLDARLRQQFLQNQIGFLFQSPHLIAELSVTENIMIKGLLAQESYKRAQQKAFELLESVGLTAQAHASPATLSGGEQQRVALARALYNQPAFILADEPTAHLDLATKNLIIQLLLSYSRRWRRGLIIATHDETVAQHMDVVLKLENGKLIELSASLTHAAKESTLFSQS